MLKFSADDIANQKFHVRFRGYDIEQVEEFLLGLAREWDHMVEEFRRLQIEVDAQNKELRDYRRREKSLVDALETAREVAEEIRHQAERDSELVLAETELKAEKMLASAEKRLSRVRSELFDIQQQRLRVESELRNTLEGHLRMLDMFSARVETDDRTEARPMPPVPGASNTPTVVMRDTDSLPVGDEDIEDARRVDEPEGDDDLPRRNTMVGLHTEHHIVINH